MIEYLGLWILLALTLNMWAWLSVMAAHTRWGAKLIWTILLVGLPGLAFVGWFLLGPRRANA